MTNGSTRLLWTGALLLAAGWIAAAPTDRYEELTGEQDDFDAVQPEWHEQRGPVPPLPAESDWQAVRLDALPSGQAAFIDLGSLSVGPDGVVRFWLQVRSRGGARMIQYAGVHCGRGERVTYAWGHPGRKPPVKLVAQPRWRPLSARAMDAWWRELADDVLCSGEVARTPRQIGQAARGRYEQMNPWDNFTNDD